MSPWRASRRGQRVAALGVGGRRIEIEGPEQAATGVADLVALAALDHQQAALAQLPSRAVDDRKAGAAHDVDPLVDASMEVVGAAFTVAGCDHHLRSLHLADREDRAETLSKIGRASCRERLKM